MRDELREAEIDRRFRAMQDDIGVPEEDELLPQVLSGLLMALFLVMVLLLPLAALAPAGVWPLLAYTALATLAHLANRLHRLPIAVFLLITAAILLAILLVPLPEMVFEAQEPELSLLFGWAIAALLTVHALIRRLTPHRRESGSLIGQTLPLLVFAVAQGAAPRLGLDHLRTPLFLLAVLYILLLLLRWHLRSTSRQWQHLESVPSQPVRQVRRFSFLLLAGFTVAAVVFFVMAGMSRPDAFLDVIWNGIRAFLRWLAGLFGNGRETPEESGEALPTQPQAPQLPSEPAQTPAWLTMLLNILQFLLSIAAVLGALIGLVYLMRLLYRRFYALRRKDGDIRESLIGEWRDAAAERLHKTRDRLRVRFGRTPVDRTRRQFYHLVEKRWPASGIKSSDSSRRITEQLDLPDSEKRAQIQSIYDRARYGGESSDEEVETLTRLIRSLPPPAKGKGDSS